MDTYGAQLFYYNAYTVFSELEFVLYPTTMGAADVCRLTSPHGLCSKVSDTQHCANQFQHINMQVKGGDKFDKHLIFDSDLQVDFRAFRNSGSVMRTVNERESSICIVSCMMFQRFQGHRESKSRHTPVKVKE